MCETQNYKIIFKGEDNNGYVRRFSIMGRWLFQEEHCSNGGVKEEDKKYSVAVTEKGKLLILKNSCKEKPFYEMFDCFDDIVQAYFYPKEILSLIAESEDFVEELVRKE